MAESNYIDNLSQCNDDFSSLQVIRSPPPSRRVTLVSDMIEVVTTQEHLVKMLRRQDIHRRHHLRLNANHALIDLSGSDNDNDDDYNKRKQYLLNVMTHKLDNVHEEMNNSINILFDNKKQVEELEFAFDVLTKFINNIDYANDFVKIGGFYIFLPCFRSEHSSVRIKTCEFISKLVQNNPYCQNKFMENTNCLKLRALMYMVENDNDNDVRVKALAAIYSLVRQNIPVFWKFIELGGKDLILNSLKTPINNLKFRAVIFIYSTNSQMDNDVLELYVDNGVVEIICSIIMDMENNVESLYHEMVLLTLNQFMHLSPVRVKEICSSVEDFMEALISLRDAYSNQPVYQKEKEEVLWLLGKLRL
ncbi:hsp70 nucleotide exchange factor FES1-like [Rhopalosiphum maidis]|uniref:hsp70 nucleotide exchange factor FES1-like n=1 Tax=Rhopalosiphum maidis TaxID=43146 RepID=UPI000EFE5B3A|nr:hsp70 nucleotide exchange factor FES1-like [Rhopalosiphum maidis]